MRIIIKPMGLLIILGAFASLTGILIASAPKSTMGLFRDSKPKTIPLTINTKASRAWRYAELVPGSGSFVARDLTNGPAGSKQSMVLTTIKANPEMIWHTQGYWDVQESFPKGQKLAFRFWARAPKTREVLAVFEQNHDPYSKELNEKISLTPEWKEFVLPFEAANAYTLDEAKVGFQSGDSVGEFEFTAPELLAYPAGAPPPSAKL